MENQSETKRTSVFTNALIWFGAGVSVAEILTGTAFAPLGAAKGIAAIAVGHVTGCALLFFAGYIGARTRRSAMETTKLSFGAWGSRFFAALNVLQLVGWTGIMIYDGSLAARQIAGAGRWVWCLVIGALIIVWIAAGITNIEKINLAAMSALLILTIVLCRAILSGRAAAADKAGGAISFGQAVELAAAMPLSWLPLISDYTKDAEKPFQATLASSVTYGVVSCWMYAIGMGAAILTGESDIAAVMVRAGLGAAGLAIVVLSTVTTTFLDAFSAGISSETIFPEIKGKYAAVAAACVGTAGAIFCPMDDITDFLYLIGSVFAPMIAIQIADFFVLKAGDDTKRIDAARMLIWAAGFAAYRLLMRLDLVTGNTLPDMALTFALCVIAETVRRRLAARKA